VLSPSTGKLDRIHKMPAYARESVQFAWLLEPVERTLEVFELANERWAAAGSYEGDAKVRAEPFDAIELALSVLWADIRRRPV
jgi:Uma2 family endonuclease